MSVFGCEVYGLDFIVHSFQSMRYVAGPHHAALGKPPDKHLVRRDLGVRV
jgi:hypothetical protein